MDYLRSTSVENRTLWGSRHARTAVLRENCGSMEALVLTGAAGRIWVPSPTPRTSQLLDYSPNSARGVGAGTRPAKGITAREAQRVPYCNRMMWLREFSQEKQPYMLLNSLFRENGRENYGDSLVGVWTMDTEAPESEIACTAEQPSTFTDILGETVLFNRTISFGDSGNETSPLSTRSNFIFTFILHITSHITNAFIMR